jgi:hypothetical protein
MIYSERLPCSELKPTIATLVLSGSSVSSSAADYSMASSRESPSPLPPVVAQDTKAATATAAHTVDTRLFIYNLLFSAQNNKQSTIELFRNFCF